MDHNEAIREFERLMEKQAEHAHTAATELEALVSHLPNEKTRQLAQAQAKASHKQAREFRDMAQKVKEN
jgi:phage-related protein